MLSATAAPASARPVLILDPTVTGGAASTLATKFVAAGHPVQVVDATQWAAMSAADFANKYDAIVLGDPTCKSTGPELPAADPVSNPKWTSAVDGNVVIIGTDETYHQGQGGALLMEKAAAFAAAQPGKTGAYISLSCYFHGTAPGTPLKLLDGFGTFTATGVGCHNNAKIVATHPALTGLTDAALSNWSCSVHEGFDSWPVSFEVLALAEGAGTAYVSADGLHVGTPYILARGVQVISDIKLTPASANNNVGTSHMVTAKVTTNIPAPGTPVVGKNVKFTVIAGPNLGITGNAVTNAAGVATFAYVGAAAGVDTIEATFVDALGHTQHSNKVIKTWVTPQVSGVDHFKCYTVQRRSINARSVTLRDQFGTRASRVLEERQLCNPVRKQVGRKITPITHPRAHLTCRRTADSPSKPQLRIVQLTNQFGTVITRTTGAQTLCIPALKRIARGRRPVPPSGFKPETVLDHYRCYGVVPQKKVLSVVLRDQFTRGDARVTQLVSFCNPVRKSYRRTVAKIKRPKVHLACYSITDGGAFKPLNVLVRNQFGVRRMRPLRAETLCLPSSKRLPRVDPTAQAGPVGPFAVRLTATSCIDAAGNIAHILRGATEPPRPRATLTAQLTGPGVASAKTQTARLAGDGTFVTQTTLPPALGTHRWSASVKADDGQVAASANTQVTEQMPRC